MGLSLKDGKEVWSITQEKGNVTSALKLPKFFPDSDGLLLKVVSSVVSNQTDEKVCCRFITYVFYYVKL